MRIWYSLVSKTAGPFCGSSKRARVKWEGARRQPPLAYICWTGQCQTEPTGLTQRHVSWPFGPSTISLTLQNNSFLFEPILHYTWPLAPPFFTSLCTSHLHPLSPSSLLHALPHFPTSHFHFAPHLTLNSVSQQWSPALLCSQCIFLIVLPLALTGQTSRLVQHICWDYTRQAENLSPWLLVFSAGRLYWTRCLCSQHPFLPRMICLSQCSLHPGSTLKSSRMLSKNPISGPAADSLFKSLRGHTNVWPKPIG